MPGGIDKVLYSFLQFWTVVKLGTKTGINRFNRTPSCFEFSASPYRSAIISKISRAFIAHKKEE